MASEQLISLVIPVHNEEENLAWLKDQLDSHIKNLGYKFEIIFVNDGSTDNSLHAIKSIAQSDPAVKYISFSRNFGKEAATSAGLRKSKGYAVIMIDSDGQHPAGCIPKFLKAWENGSQVVIGVRTKNDKEGLVKKYGSSLFYATINAISDGKTIPRSTDFRLLDRKVVEEFNRLTERNRITRGLIDWLGFKRAVIEFQSPARHSGRASYSFSNLTRLALHAFVSQTTQPLKFIGYLGASVTILSALAGIFLIIEMYLLNDPLGLAVTGTAMLALFVSFLVGLVLTSNWLMALYVESIHTEAQNRPLYIVSEEN